MSRKAKLAEFYYFCTYLSVSLIVQCYFPHEAGPEERTSMQVTYFGKLTLGKLRQERKKSQKVGVREQPTSMDNWASVSLGGVSLTKTKQNTFAFVPVHDKVIAV